MFFELFLLSGKGWSYCGTKERLRLRKQIIALNYVKIFNGAI